MIEEDPNKRMTIQEIKRSQWYQGPVYEKEEEFQEAMRNYLQL